MVRRYTTRQARQNLAELLRAARDGDEVVITAPNEVAVRLVPERPSALAAFRTWKESAVEIEDDPFADVRDKSTGRRVKL